MSIFKLFFCLFFTFLSINSIAQFTLISQFNWNSNPVTTATFGPNATSVSGSAGSSPGGVGGTNGLNALACCTKQDIDLVIPGSPTFDVGGIDVWIDFQREESVGNFFTRGSSINFGMNGGNLFVSYRVSDGAGGFNTVNSGNVYAIPNDDIFRTYRFMYEPTRGMGEIQVNGVIVWSNDGPDNRNLYWTGSGNVIVGQLMDGSGVNETIMDNLRVYSVSTSPLPIELSHFSATLNNESTVDLDWETASETDNERFVIERSLDGTNWDYLLEHAGAGNSSIAITYHAIDYYPHLGINYYRLKQIDFNGDYTYSDVESIMVLKRTDNFTLLPNLTSNFIVISSKTESGMVDVIDSKGSIVLSTHINQASITVAVHNWPNGIYFAICRDDYSTNTLKFIKY